MPLNLLDSFHGFGNDGESRDGWRICLGERLYLSGERNWRENQVERGRCWVTSLDVTSDSSLSWWYFMMHVLMLYFFIEWYSFTLHPGCDNSPYNVEKCKSSHECGFFLTILLNSSFKTTWHMNSACQTHRGRPAESTPPGLSFPAPLYSIINMIDGAQSENPVWGQVMATGAWPV